MVEAFFLSVTNLNEYLVSTYTITNTLLALSTVGLHIGTHPVLALWHPFQDTSIATTILAIAALGGCNSGLFRVG